MINTNLSHVGTGGMTCDCATEVDVLVENVIDNPYREDNIIVSTHLDHADLIVTVPQNLKPNTYIKYVISCYPIKNNAHISVHAMQMAKGAACGEGFDSGREECRGI